MGIQTIPTGSITQFVQIKDGIPCIAVLNETNCYISSEMCWNPNRDNIDMVKCENFKTSKVHRVLVLVLALNPATAKARPETRSQATVIGQRPTINGQRPQPMVTARGHDQRPRPKTAVNGHGQLPRPTATVRLQSLDRVVATVLPSLPAPVLALDIVSIALSLALALVLAVVKALTLKPEPTKNLVIRTCAGAANNSHNMSR